jgi:hypothetical protein
VADEHFKEAFNPPAADYGVLDAFLKWLAEWQGIVRPNEFMETN